MWQHRNGGGRRSTEGLLGSFQILTMIRSTELFVTCCKEPSEGGTGDVPAGDGAEPFGATISPELRE